MPLWSNINQSVNVSSSTTKETTQGAPIGTYNLVNGKAGSAKVPAGPNAVFGNTSPGSMAGIDLNLFQNTTPGSFNYGKTVGVFGVTANQMSNNTLNGSKNQPAHAGWVFRRAGTGPIVSVSYTGTATGYSNGDIVMFNSGEAAGVGSNNVATAVISTNSTGGSLTFNLTYGGHGFANVANNPGTAANSTGGASSGSGATFIGTAGGRAGRITNETLVAMGSMTNPNGYVSNPIFPGTT